MIYAPKPTDILQIAHKVLYRYDLFTDFERTLQESIRAYAPPYGQNVFAHLKRTSFHLENYLRTHNHGLSDVAITNIVHAFRFHDGGKTMQRPDLWDLDEAPSKDDPRRAERREHGRSIIPWLEKHLEKFPEISADDPYIQLIAAFGVYHHERIDGRGPEGLSGNQLGTILELAGIVDTIDGKLMPRKNKPPRTEAEALREMTGDTRYTKKRSHRGEFDTGLLKKYIAHRQSYCRDFILEEIDRGLAPHPFS